MTVHRHIFRSVHRHQRVGQPLAQFLGVCFHDDVRTVVQRLFLAVRMLKIHQIDLVGGHAAGGDG